MYFFKIFSKFLEIPSYVNPLALSVTMLIFLLNPTKTFVHEARFWFLRTLVIYDNFLIEEIEENI